MRSVLFLGAMAALAASPAIEAHHSANAFDLQHPVIATGTVKTFFWGNPHTWLYLEVPNDKDGVDEWPIEGPALTELVRVGWTKDTLKPGDHVSVTLAPRKDGGHAGTFYRVQLADGTYMLTPRLDNSALINSGAKIGGR